MSVVQWITKAPTHSPFKTNDLRLSHHHFTSVSNYLKLKYLLCGHYMLWATY